MSRYTNPYRSPIGVKRKSQSKATAQAGVPLADAPSVDAPTHREGTTTTDATHREGATTAYVIEISNRHLRDRAAEQSRESIDREGTTTTDATHREGATTADVIESSNRHLRDRAAEMVQQSRESIDRSLLQLELVRAVHRQDHVDAAHLIAHGANVKLLDANGECPMRVALQAREASEFHWPMVKLLAEHGADGTTPDANGVNPLMIACRSGSLPAVMALFANATKRDLASKNKKGENCLFSAVRSRRVDVVQFISSRMNPYGIQRRNISGDSVFHLAAKFGERVMLQHLRKNEGGRLDTLMRQNNRKWSPIHFAIFGGHLLVVRQLLKWGVPDLSEEETRRLLRLGEERSEAYLREGIPMATPEERCQVRLFLAKRREMKERKQALFGSKGDEDVPETNSNSCNNNERGVGYARSSSRRRR